MNIDTLRKRSPLIRIIFLLLGALGAVLLATDRTQTTSSDTVSPDPYERVTVWDVRGDDTVRFTVLDTYPDESPGRSKWFSTPLIWNDADIAEVTPLAGTLIDQYANDYAYRGQSYRLHSYFIESDRSRFGYSITFKVVPHLHINDTTSRLLSIGVEPSDEAGIQTSSVIAVVLPDGVREIAITDMQPYKALTDSTRALYYYDVHSITAHQSIHISYTLIGIPTTDIDLGTVSNYSNP